MTVTNRPKDTLILLLLLALIPLASLSSVRADAINPPPSPGQDPNNNSTAPNDPQQLCSHILARSECGYLGITQDQCRQRQCCWNPVMAPVPWCFERKNEDYQCRADAVTRRECGFYGITEKTWYGYAVKSAEESDSGLTIHLQLQGTCQRYGQDVSRLTVLVDFETQARIRVRIVDADQDRYEIPTTALRKSSATAQDKTSGYLQYLAYRFEYIKYPFTFSVIRIATGEKIFDSNVAGMDSLVYEDEYLEISTTLPANPDDTNLYGLGEVVAGFRRDARGTRQTIWARDAPTPIGENLYGSHPFHLEMRRINANASSFSNSSPSGVAAHGVFLRNSNGMDVIISPGKLTYKVIGGILDFSIFLGPHPAAVVDQYTELIGRPHFPPAWAMGWHQSRYGYANIEAVENVVARYQKEDLPLDGVWIDIDYMNQFRDFTYDELRFPQERIKSLASSLANSTQNMILIIDPGIAVQPGYDAYEDGMANEVFLMRKDPSSGKPTTQPVEGRVWPGQTYFPDFLNSNETWAFWERQLRKTRLDLGENVYPWIDMNEPSSFCNGECSKNDPATGSSDEQSYEQTKAKGMQYSINNAGHEASLEEKTVAHFAIHKNGIKFSDTHNLYGHLEAMATHKALLNMRPDQRPFILTRSSFAGTGAYAAHWTGDNSAEWSHLYFSIPGILNFGLFGIPFTGSDICGFNGNTTEELCLRWHQLGSLYPFSRNHNDIHASDQEPYQWPTSVLPAARQALRIRYSLHPYFYSRFELAHRTGRPVWQPLWFEFPEDLISWKIDRQFLLGNGIMVSPALYAGQIQVKAYFPGKGRWFDLWSHECLIEDDDHHINPASMPTTSVTVKNSKVKGKREDKVRPDRGAEGKKEKRRPFNKKDTNGRDTSTSDDDDRPYRYKFLPAKADRDPIPMSLAGGHVVPIQEPRLTIAETRLTPVSLIIALDETGHAVGSMYVDNGESNMEPSFPKNSDKKEKRGPRQDTIGRAWITWELKNGTYLSSQVDTTTGSGLQYGSTIDSVVLLGLNFERVGGELEHLSEEDIERLWSRRNQNRGSGGQKTSTIYRSKTKSNRKDDKKEQQQIFLSQNGIASNQYDRPARKRVLRSLNINGVNATVPSSSLLGSKSQDSETGVAWEVNEASGSMTLTGLKMDLLGDWFLRWSLE
ncbi:hypothetical protein BGZ83_006665 [Gryganskiella cystojenkinii]|nr:hypothetical protein BGZ83_006665 [Gryganskiella cystojenkinii]